MSPTRAICEQAKADFDRDGYAVIRQFLSGDEVRKLIGEIDRYIKDVLPRLQPDQMYYADKSDPDSLFRLSSMEQHDTHFAAYGRDEPLQYFAAMLLGDDAKLEAVNLFGKAPRVGEQTPVHQDGYYFMLEPNEALTIWMPLDRTDEENGCIRYVPGSHTRGLRPHGRGEMFGFSQGLSDFNPEDQAKEVAIIAEPGDLIVHHSLTIHRADSNPSDRRRWAMGFVYFADRAIPDKKARQAYKEKLSAEMTAEGKI